MSETIRVLLGLTPLDERLCTQALYENDEAPMIVAAASDTEELVRQAREQDAEAALLSAGLPGLTPRACAELEARGVTLVGCAASAQARPLLEALGVSRIVELPLTSAELAGALGPHAEREAQNGAAEPAPKRAAAASRARTEAAGSIVTVLGSKGAPGASELAASLAGVLAERWRVLLAELDAAGGGLDLRLGADPRDGSLLGLLRALRAGDEALSELVGRWLSGGDKGWPAVLLGPPLAELETVRSGETTRALQALANDSPLVVCDSGVSLAADLHREAVLCADAVLLVLGAREEQLRAGLRQLEQLLDELALEPQRLRVVVNGLRAPGAIRELDLRREAAARLAEFGLAVDGWLPWDERALKQAQRLGLPLALARRRGPYAKALRALTEELFLPVRPMPIERKAKLSPGGEARGREEVELSWR